MSVPEGPPLTEDQKQVIAQNQATLLLDEAAKMREFRPPGETAGPPDVYSALVFARGKLDRLEAVLVSVIALRDAAQVEARKLEQVADDAWDDLANQARTSGSRYEYEGAQERYATWRYKVRGRREAARAARNRADVLASAEKSVQVMYRGLDSSRLDLHRRLSALTVMRSNEL